MTIRFFKFIRTHYLSLIGPFSILLLIALQYTSLLATSNSVYRWNHNEGFDPTVRRTTKASKRTKHKNQLHHQSQQETIRTDDTNVSWALDGTCDDHPYQSIFKRDTKDHPITCGFCRNATETTKYLASLRDEMSKRYSSKCQDMVVYGAALGTQYEHWMTTEGSLSNHAIRSVQRHQTCFFQFVTNESGHIIVSTNNTENTIMMSADGSQHLIVIDKSKMPYQNNRRNTKILKLNPGLLFPWAQRIIWQDAKMLIKEKWEMIGTKTSLPFDYILHFNRTIERFGTCVSYMGLPHHPAAIGKRGSMYTLDAHCHTIVEAAKSRPTVSDNLEILVNQCQRYQQEIGEGPTSRQQNVTDLIDSAFIVYDMRSSQCQKFNGDFTCSWLDEIHYESDRDQVSFPYVIHKSGLQLLSQVPGYDLRDKVYTYSQSAEPSDNPNRTGSKPKVHIAKRSCHWYYQSFSRCVEPPNDEHGQNVNSLPGDDAIIPLSQEDEEMDQQEQGEGTEKGYNEEKVEERKKVRLSSFFKKRKKKKSSAPSPKEENVRSVSTRPNDTVIPSSKEGGEQKVEDRVERTEDDDEEDEEREEETKGIGSEEKKKPKSKKKKLRVALIIAGTLDRFMFEKTLEKVTRPIARSGSINLDFYLSLTTGTAQAYRSSSSGGTSYTDYFQQDPALPKSMLEDKLDIEEFVRKRIGNAPGSSVGAIVIKDRIDIDSEPLLKAKRRRALRDYPNEDPDTRFPLLDIRDDDHKQRTAIANQNLLKLHYAIQQLWQTATKWELEEEFNYDFVIFMRDDSLWFQKFNLRYFDKPEFADSDIFIPSCDARDPPMDRQEINDHILISRRNVSDLFGNYYETLFKTDMSACSQRLSKAVKSKGKRGCNSEMILKYVTDTHDVNVTKVGQSMMPFQRSANVRLPDGSNLQCFHKFCQSHDSPLIIEPKKQLQKCSNIDWNKVFNPPAVEG